MKTKLSLIFLLAILLCFASCESEQEKQTRLKREEQQRIELAQQEELRRVEREKLEAEQRAAEESRRIEREKREAEQRAAEQARLEKERQEREEYNRYINNSLSTGATPYSYLYGGNRSCNDYGCSQIKVRTSNSDVLVTIKRNDKVVRHAYIRSNSSYTFEMPNGTYQPFFYYGKGWNPEKVMKQTTEGTVKGGFIEEEYFGKDYPQTLNNNILEYQLILQTNGNFSTKPSNAADAL
ncbi:MAG: hypothetical protein LBS54_01155 [Dysgonamonadaceae bacterium]|jgi:hypothetical protein|nr:hypothetical protein [Dysgonamonadaceae bacterium]